MLRFIVRIIGTFVRYVFWDSDRVWQDRQRYGRAAHYSSNPRAPRFTCQQGRIHGRVYINESATGKRYMKAQFGTGKKGGELAYSYERRDLGDLKKCIDKANAWMRDSGLA